MLMSMNKISPPKLLSQAKVKGEVEQERKLVENNCPIPPYTAEKSCALLLTRASEAEWKA